MAFDEELEAKWEKGKRLTILSIDGGGVRGIIPAKILQMLEGYLQKAEKNPERRLWEYFDMIAGTSSGGLITAMITTPSAKDPRVPSCNATEVLQFFQRDAASIFPAIFSNNWRLRWLLEGFASVFGPIYCAKPLEDLLFEKFRDRHLSDALTSVIIPAFDTNNEVPVFFSKLKGVDSVRPPLYDVKVKNACRATTAVPIFFPAAKFEEDLGDGSIKQFNVIDGGIAVNDPTLVAVMITQEIEKKRQAIANGQASVSSQDCMDFSNVLVLSLGTGEHPMRFIAKRHWSSVQWLLNLSGSPLLNSFLSASEEMVEYYTSMIFDAHQSGHHYLRIQTERLSRPEFWGIDDATEQNLDNLTNQAKDLLTKNVKKRNFATGELEDIPDGGRNDQALQRFAKWLVDERRKRAEGQQPVDEPSRTGQELPGTSDQQTAVDRCCSTAVGGCCSRMRAVLGWVCLMMRVVLGGFCLMMETALGGFRAIIILPSVFCLPVICFFEVLIMWLVNPLLKLVRKPDRT